MGLKIYTLHCYVISVKTVLFLPQFHALSSFLVCHFHVLLFHALHIGPSISCPAISCPAILMVRHFHVQHFQSTPVGWAIGRASGQQKSTAITTPKCLLLGTDDDE